MITFAVIKMYRKDDSRTVFGIENINPDDPNVNYLDSDMVCPNYEGRLLIW